MECTLSEFVDDQNWGD